MFFHLYKYRIRVLMRKKLLMFWSMLFPIVLGTLFYFGFGSATEKNEAFKTISVAVAAEKSQEGDLLATMKQIESEGVPMFTVTETTRAEAEELLAAKKIDGLVVLGDKPTLYVTSSGLNQTILRSFLSQYQRVTSLYGEVAATNPAAISEIVSLMAAENSYLQETTLGGEAMDTNLQYFYALLAMACLYGSFFGLQNAEDIMANITPLAARRHVAPTHHMKQIVADMLAAFTLHYANSIVVVGYLRFVLKRDIVGEVIPFLLILFIGCIIGVSIGQFVGCIAKKSEGMRVALSLTASMVMSMFAGLFFAEMKYIIDQNAPIINRLNPAALITDAFYSLSVYSDYGRFTSSLVTLAVITVVLMSGCYFSVRRTRYASI